MWEPPTVDDDGAEGVPPTLRALVGPVKGVKYTEMESVEHVLSHRRLSIRVFAGEAKKADFEPNDEYEKAEWMTSAELDAVGVSTLARKVLAAGGGSFSASRRAGRARPKRST